MKNDLITKLAEISTQKIGGRNESEGYAKLLFVFINNFESAFDPKIREIRSKRMKAMASALEVAENLKRELDKLQAEPVLRYERESKRYYKKTIGVLIENLEKSTMDVLRMVPPFLVTAKSGVSLVPFFAKRKKNRSDRSNQRTVEDIGHYDRISKEEVTYWLYQLEEFPLKTTELPRLTVVTSFISEPLSEIMVNNFKNNLFSLQPKAIINRLDRYREEAENSPIKRGDRDSLARASMKKIRFEALINGWKDPSSNNRKGTLGTIHVPCSS